MQCHCTRIDVPLGLPPSTRHAPPLTLSYFVFRAPQVQKRLAVGFDNGRPVDPVELGWEAPCGGLLASTEDISRLMMLMLSPSTGTTVVRPPLTHRSLRTSLAPSVLLGDGSEAIGSPWETLFVNTSAVCTPGGVVEWTKFGSQTGAGCFGWSTTAVGWRTTAVVLAQNARY